MPPRRSNPLDNPHTPVDGLPLFSGLPASELSLLREASREIHLPANQPLYDAGESIRDIHILVAGSIKRGALSAAGGEKVIELVAPGHIVGLGESFGADRYGAHAHTLSDSLLIAIDAALFRSLVGRNAELSARIVAALARRQCAVEFESVSQHVLTGTQRVLDYLIDQAGGALPLAGESIVRLESSKKLVASRIGIAPETFSRTLRQLSDSGVIVVAGRKLHLQNAILALKGREAEPKALRGLQRKSAARSATGITAGSLINLCGRQRMLSQRMAIAWAMTRRQIAPLGARITLRQAIAQFERNLRRLRTSVSAGPTAAALARLNALWPGYRNALLGQEQNAPTPEQVLDLSEEVLDAADRLTAAAEAAFGTPEGTRVNVAGRNRMLSQRLTKLFLFRTWGIEREAVAAMMTAAIPEFAANLERLRDAADVDPALAEQLRIVGQLWLQFLAMIHDTTKRSGGISHVRAVLAANDRLLRHVDTTVKLYEYLAE